MTCERCGVALHVGDYPFCGGDPSRHARQANSVIGDEIDEVIPDLDPDGLVLHFRSRIEKQKYLDAHNLEPFVRNAGPLDRHVPRWDAVDAQTLANAAALCDPARRTAGGRPKAVCETAQFVVRAV